MSEVSDTETLPWSGDSENEIVGVSEGSADGESADGERNSDEEIPILMLRYACDDYLSCANPNRDALLSAVIAAAADLLEINKSGYRIVKSAELPTHFSYAREPTRLIYTPRTPSPSPDAITGVDGTPITAMKTLSTEGKLLI